MWGQHCNHRVLYSPPQTSANSAPSALVFYSSLALRSSVRIRSAPGSLGPTELTEVELRDPQKLSLVY